MSLGLRNDRRSRRRRLRWATLKWLVALGAIVAAGGYAYQTGTRLAEGQIIELRSTTNALSQRVVDLESQLGQEKEATGKALSEAETWRQKYEQDVPSGDIRPLIEAMAHHLAAGVPPSRLLSAIDDASDPRSCEGSSTTRRLEVQTPLNSGKTAKASIRDRGLTVSVEGESARSSAGDPEFWFDSDKPVTVVISKPGGLNQKMNGMLPLYPLATSGNTEYRFTIAPSVRGFVEITMLKCANK